MMMFSRFDICLHREGNRNSKYCNSRDVWLSCVHVHDQKEKKFIGVRTCNCLSMSKYTIKMVIRIVHSLAWILDTTV